MKTKPPEILLVGRPNVGKSTLFNRLTGKPLALVDDRPGTTRDLKSALVEWDGKLYRFTDSGGWLPDPGEDAIAGQVGRLIDEKSRAVDLLLFLVDGSEGITSSDLALARHFREMGHRAILVVNKADNVQDTESFLSDFQRLGFSDQVALSAMHGIGVDALLDLAAERLTGKESTSDVPEEAKAFKVAILGKPNVGKSSLLNALLGKNLLVVHDTPGTTHDAVSVVLEQGERDLVAVDTAGIRSHKQVVSRVEKLSIDQALYELQTCQVALFLLDGEKGVTHQDVTLSNVLSEAFRPVVLVINKWDIHPKGSEQAWAEREVRRQLRTLSFAPLVFVSAKNKMGIEKVLPLAKKVYEESCRRISTASFNRALQEALSRQAPPFRKGNRLKPLYGFQRQGHPPVFEVFANHPESSVPSYIRFLEDSLRASFDLRYTPMQVVFKAKREPKGKAPRRKPPPHPSPRKRKP